MVDREIALSGPVVPEAPVANLQAMYPRAGRRNAEMMPAPWRIPPRTALYLCASHAWMRASSSAAHGRSSSILCRSKPL